jgi:hypothetical protein
MRTSYVSSIPTPTYKVQVNVSNQLFDYSDLKRIAEHLILENGTLLNTDLFYTLLNKDSEPKNAIDKNDSNKSTALFVKDSYDNTIFKNFAVLPNEYRFVKNVGYTDNNVEYYVYDDINSHNGSSDNIYLNDDLESLHSKLSPELKDLLFDIDTNDFKQYIALIAKLAYIKRTIKTTPKYVNSIYAANSEYLLDDEGYIFIGLSDDLLYNYNNDTNIYELNDATYILNKLRLSDTNTAVIDMDNLLTVSNDLFETIAAEYEVELSKPSDQLIKDNISSIVRWYPQDIKKVKIPTTLSTNINVGDIIYFYTDEATFINTSRIEYMVTITKDLIGADIQTLINAAVTTYPFEYSVMDSDIINNRGVVNNTVNIMANNSNNKISTGFDNFQFRSIENLLSKNDYCTLHLISVNYKNQYNKNGFI